MVPEPLGVIYAVDVSIGGGWALASSLRLEQLDGLL